MRVREAPPTPSWSKISSSAIVPRWGLNTTSLLCCRCTQTGGCAENEQFPCQLLPRDCSSTPKGLPEICSKRLRSSKPSRSWIEAAACSTAELVTMGLINSSKLRCSSAVRSHLLPWQMLDTQSGIFLPLLSLKGEAFKRSPAEEQTWPGLEVVGEEFTFHIGILVVSGCQQTTPHNRPLGEGNVRQCFGSLQRLI